MIGCLHNERSFFILCIHMTIKSLPEPWSILGWEEGFFSLLLGLVGEVSLWNIWAVDNWIVFVIFWMHLMCIAHTLMVRVSYIGWRWQTLYHLSFSHTGSWSLAIFCSVDIVLIGSSPSAHTDELLFMNFMIFILCFQHYTI